MKITDADSSRLARFLSKGIFGTPGTKDVNITIGENAQIGIERRGHKYFLYIRYNGIVDKADLVTGFNENIAMDDLASKIKNLIGNSITIRDVVLNMEKVPMLPEEVMADTTKEPESAANATDPVQILEETPVSEVTAHEMIAESLTDGNPITVHARQTATNATTPLPQSMLTNGTTMNDATGVSTEITGEQMQDELEVEQSNETYDEDDSIYAEVDGQPVAPDDSDPQINDEEEDMEMDAMTTGMDNTRIENSIGIKGLMPARVDNKKVLEESYLASVVGSDAEIKQKMNRAVEQLIARDKGSAIEFYSRMLYRLLPSFNNDVSSAATGTGLDERDFMLSVYEKPLFGK